MPAPDLRSLHRSLGIPADYGKRRNLKRFREASRLVPVGRTPDGARLVRLAPRAAAAWSRMQAAAARDGVQLLAFSGFRSVARQAKIIRAKLAAGRSIDEVLTFLAAPGFSEHHTGCAIDIGLVGTPPLTERFAQTPAFAWLKRHARRFGFQLSFPRRNPHGIIYEPWHWRWHARPNSRR